MNVVLDDTLLGVSPARPELQSLYHRTISQPIPLQYTLQHTLDCLNPENPTLHQMCQAGTTERALIVIDQGVLVHPLQAIHHYFQFHGTAPTLVTLHTSETRKTWTQVHTLLTHFDAFGLLRRSQPVVAIGGGIVLDAVGFACSIYRRGVPYLRVPTTLLAQVDAAIGVKTGVSHNHKKNRIGTYFAPQGVLIDPLKLATLPPRQLRNGMAEILKIALVIDPTLFSLLENSGKTLIQQKFQGHPHAHAVIYRAVERMVEQLEHNLHEHQLDRLVDFGHALSPALEMAHPRKLLHGEAVAIDMALMVTVALHRGMLTPEQHQRILQVFQQLGLPITPPTPNLDLLWEGLQDVVRHRDGLQRLPMPTGIGNASFIHDLTREELGAALLAHRPQP